MGFRWVNSRRQRPMTDLGRLSIPNLVQLRRPLEWVVCFARFHRLSLVLTFSCLRRHVRGRCSAIEIQQREIRWPSGETVGRESKGTRLGENKVQGTREVSTSENPE